MMDDGMSWAPVPREPLKRQRGGDVDDREMRRRSSSSSDDTYHHCFRCGQQHMRVMSPCRRPVSHLAPCFYADATCPSLSGAPRIRSGRCAPVTFMEEQLVMCLSCKWSDPATFVLGTFGSNPPEPGLADVMAVRVPHVCEPLQRRPTRVPPPRYCAQTATRQMAARWQVAARPPNVTSAVSEADDALLEQLATDELGRRKLNPRKPNSGMMRGF